MTLVAVITAALAVWVWLGGRATARLGGGERLPVRAKRAGPVRRRRHDQETRARLLAQAPIVADLLSSAIRAGATPGRAVSAVAQALQQPSRDYLSRVANALELGASPKQAWSELLAQSALAPIAHAFVRSSETGSPIARVLDEVAHDLRREHRSEVEILARAAGVRSVAPLALCFLPAYLLVGVVPVVASFASGMRW